MNGRDPSSFSLASIFFAGAVVGAFFFSFALVFGNVSLATLSEDHGSTLAAFTTIAAIFIALHVHHREMDTERDREERTRIRKSNAYRARMSSALSDMIIYTRTSYEQLQHDRPYPALPISPQNGINLLSDSIEYADDDSSKTLTMLVSDYQVFDARINANHNSRNDLVITLVNLHLQTEYLFNYARHEETLAPRIRQTRRNMLAALNSVANHTYTGRFYAADVRLIQARYPE